MIIQNTFLEKKIKLDVKGQQTVSMSTRQNRQSFQRLGGQPPKRRRETSVSENVFPKVNSINLFMTFHETQIYVTYLALNIC